jgi:hypothetical protein
MYFIELGIKAPKSLQTTTWPYCNTTSRVAARTSRRTPELILIYAEAVFDLSGRESRECCGEYRRIESPSWIHISHLFSIVYQMAARNCVRKCVNFVDFLQESASPGLMHVGESLQRFWREEGRSWPRSDSTDTRLPSADFEFAANTVNL